MKKKHKVVTVNLPLDIYRGLKAEAEAELLTVGAVLRRHVAEKYREGFPVMTTPQAAYNNDNQEAK